MRLFFYECVDERLRFFFESHDCQTVALDSITPGQVVTLRVTPA